MADKKISALTAATTPLAGTEVLPIVQSGATVKVAVSDLTAGRVVSASGGTFKATTAYGTVSVDNTGTTGGGAFSAKQNGATSGIVGVSGAIRGDTSSNFGIFSETGKSIEIFVNGDATAVGSFTTAGNYAPASGKGIDFSATSGAGTSELLADYEEGNYTGTLTPSTSGTITVNAAADQMNYTKIGRVVYVSGFLEVGSVSAPVGTDVLLNLPFTISNLAKDSSRFGTAIFADGAVRALTGYNSGTSVYITTTAALVAAGDQFYISFNYIAA